MTTFKYLADVDEAKLKMVEENLSEFTTRLDPKVILPEIRECLPEHEYIRLHKLGESCENTMRVNQQMWQILKRAPKWWKYLEAALKQWEYTDLLKIMEQVNPIPQAQQI